MMLFDAFDVPHAAPTPTARFAVVSTVTVRSACVIGSGLIEDVDSAVPSTSDP